MRTILAKALFSKRMYRSAKTGVAAALLLFFTPAFAQKKAPAKKAAHSRLTITDESGRNAGFIMRGEAKFEIQNNQFNVAVLSENNALFEITGVPVQALKDTSLGQRGFRMLLIASQNEKSYKSNEKPDSNLLTIKCRSAKAGSPVALMVKGKVYNSEKYYSIDGALYGKVPEPKNTTIRDLK